MNSRRPRRSISKVRQDGFIGWKPIINLTEEAMNTEYYKNPSPMLPDAFRLAERERLRIRDRDLVSAMFLLGGRISEVLMTISDNFIIEKDFIFCTKIPLLKRYSIQKEVVDVMTDIPSREESKLYKWIPEEGNFVKYRKTIKPEIMIRKDFCIPRWEPLTEYLIERIENSEKFLFPTNYQVTRKETSGVQEWILKEFEDEKRKWISPQRSYQIVTDLGERLGLEVWDHWFRAQRASQLFRDYQFTEPYLNAFFGWSGAWKGNKESTAEGYTGVGTSTLEDQMRLNFERHTVLLGRDLKR